MPVNRKIIRNEKPVEAKEGAKMLRAFVMLEALYEQYDRAEAELVVTIGKPICKEACGLCCSRMTPVVSRLEALYILSSASFLPTYQDLKASSEQWLTDQQIEFHDDLAAFAQDFKALQKVGCPYLAPDKTCMVYRFRPLACRAYGVTRLADPWCPRPLHYMESDTQRMGIGQDTSMGRSIKRNLEGITAHVKSWRNELTQRGLLPSFIAKEIVPADKLSAMPIAPAKRLRQESPVSPFIAEQWVTGIMRQMEMEHAKV